MAVLQLVVSQAPCNDRNWEFAGLQKFGRAGLIALAAAALCYTDSEPAQAYKGGGPYGSEVTRGQDLTGKDFSGRTLNKQDFKTSILRQANFKGAKLLGASFFDSDLTGHHHHPAHVKTSWRQILYK
jgi:hypothetical protein